MILKFINSILFIVVGFSVQVNAQNKMPNIEKVAFSPALLLNEDPLCSTFLDETKKSFFSTNDQIIAHFQKTLTPFELTNEFDVEGRKIYWHFLNYRGCGSACDQYQMIVDSKPINRESNFPNNFSEQIKNSSPEPTDDGSSIFFRYSNNQYFMLTLTDNIKILKLNADATWKKMCVISVNPTDEQIVNSSEVKKSLELLERKLNPILGQEGHMCGSMRTLMRKKLEAKENLRVVLYRPWIWKDINHRVMDNLSKWSKQDISHKLVFDEFQEQLEVTQKDLTRYYHDEFKWSYDQSSQIAKTALAGAVSSGFWFGDQQEMAAEKLRSAIVQKMPLREIKLLAEQEKNIPDQVLNLAVDQPEVLNYLLGVVNKPDLQNEFNKTLLMYAAQHNDIEPAKILLRHGANPNLSTIIPNDSCAFMLTKSGMTALHYAVRYASAEFVNLLLENGASPYLKTSEKNGAHPVDWLKKYTSVESQELNINLSKDDAITLESKLALPDADQIPKLVEKYNVTAEIAYKNQHYQKAYSNSINAMGLDENNERALSDLSLIALKIGRQDVALEAIDKLIKNGKDVNQKANAWFNYGLNCKRSGYHYYNGQSYCNNIPVFYFLESYKLKPSDARKNKIIDEMRVSDCKFPEKEIYISDRVVERNNRFFYVLSKSGFKLTANQFSWIHEHKVRDENNRYVKVNELKHPMDMKLLYTWGNYDLTMMITKDYDGQPISFALDQCI